jgi:hypothetical protein
LRLFIDFTGVSILRRFRYIHASLRPILGLARHVGFAKLKKVANQERSWFKKSIWTEAFGG